MRRVAMFLVAGCATLAGCGGGDTTETVTAPAEETPTSPDQPRVSEKRAKEKAKAAAKAGVLRLTDFPSGWQEKDSNDDSGGAATCPQIKSAKEAVLARASASDFSDDGDQTASGSVYVYPTESEADHWFEELTSSATRQCVRKFVPDNIRENLKEEDATVGDVTSSKVATDPLGDAAATSRIEVEIKMDIVNTSVVVDLVVVRSGRAIAAFALSNVGDPFDAEVRLDLFRASVQRLRDSLATDAPNPTGATPPSTAR